MQNNKKLEAQKSILKSLGFKNYSGEYRKTIDSKIRYACVEGKDQFYGMELMAGKSYWDSHTIKYFSSFNKFVESVKKCKFIY